jgi:hypothetical protein
VTAQDPTHPDPTAPDPTDPDPTAVDPSDDAARRRATRDRRRREVFGDVLDGSTLDDRPEPGTRPEQDRWLRDNVPPHHGD